MHLRYSTSDAKARFSEVVRIVRSGKSVIISYQGEDVAEVVPITKKHSSINQRIEELEKRGALEISPFRKKSFQPIASRPGALKRFLKDRNN